MLKQIFVASLASIGLSVGTVASDAAAGDADADAARAAACRTHFASDGGFLTGRKYVTYLDLPTVPKSEAHSRISAALARDGWNITNSDPDAGIISASQGVLLGRGSTAPLLVVVEAATPGSKVTATFRTVGGQIAEKETIRKKLCGYLRAASLD